MLAALLTLVVLGQEPPPQAAAGPPAALTADEVQEDVGQHVTVAKGNALLRIGTLTLRADEVRYASDTGRFEIPGPLFGVDGTTLILAESGEGTTVENESPDSSPGSDLLLHEARIEEYRWLPKDVVVQVHTPDEVRAGRTLLMAVEGKTLRRLGARHYELDGIRVSPCACTTGHCRLDWALAAVKADVHAGDYALLDLPQLQIADLPVPLLRPPELYVPLGQRRSGFLLPHLLWQSQNGFLLDEPFYLTLGQSYDTTISAGDITGGSGTAAANGVKGPKASAEFRYAPSDGLTGRLQLNLLDDRDTDDGEVRGLRGSFRAVQVQNFDPRDGDRLDINLVSDARLTGQLTTDLLYSQIPATRSMASVFHRGADWLLTLDGTFLQDFQGDFDPNNVHGLLFGPGTPHTSERLPAVTLEVPDHPLDGTPLHSALSLSALREGPLSAGYDNLSLANTAPYSLVPLSSVAKARSAAEQLDVLPELRWPFQLERFATGTLAASWRQDLWLFENPPLPDDLSGAPLSQAGERGYAIFDAQLATEISRTFGEGNGKLRHSIAPEIDLRAIPFQVRGGTVPGLWLTPLQPVLDHSTGLLVAQSLPLPYDDISESAGLTAPLHTAPGTLSESTTPGGIAQGQLHLDQRLRRRSGDLLRLDVGENFDGHGPEQTWALGALTLGPFHFNGFGELSDQQLPCPSCLPVDRSLRWLTEAWLDTGLTDGRGDQIGANLVRTLAAGAPRFGAPLDLLFSQLPPATDPRWRLPDVDQLGFGATAQIVYGFNVHANAAYQLSGGAFSQINVGGGYASRRHCCNLDVNAVFQPPAPGQLSFAALFVALDLGELLGTTQTH